MLFKCQAHLMFVHRAHCGRHRIGRKPEGGGCFTDCLHRKIGSDTADSADSDLPADFFDFLHFGDGNRIEHIRCRFTRRIRLPGKYMGLIAQLLRRFDQRHLKIGSTDNREFLHFSSGSKLAVSSTT